jgi:hypothetical protein
VRCRHAAAGVDARLVQCLPRAELAALDVGRVAHVAHEHDTRR